MFLQLREKKYKVIGPLVGENGETLTKQKVSMPVSAPFLICRREQSYLELTVSRAFFLREHGGMKFQNLLMEIGGGVFVPKKSLSLSFISLSRVPAPLFSRNKAHNWDC